MSECRFSETLHAGGSDLDEAIPLFGPTQWRAYTVQQVVVTMDGTRHQP